MIVIVEGIDRVGKTTLCNKLKEDLGFPVYKDDGIIDVKDMSNDEETDKMLKLLDLCEVTSCDIIFDRFHFTDYVYGVLEREYKISDALANFSLINAKLMNMTQDVVVIYVLPVDVDMSSKEHGKDLKCHNDLMYNRFLETKVSKFRCTYNTLDEAEIYIKSKIREGRTYEHRL